jgi:hypothetical protein
VLGRRLVERHLADGGQTRAARQLALDRVESVAVLQIACHRARDGTPNGGQKRVKLF